MAEIERREPEMPGEDTHFDLVASLKTDDMTEAGFRQPDSFEPDFGNAFDDYGDYRAPTAEPVVHRIRKPSLIKKIKIPKLLFFAVYFAIVVGLGILAGNFAWKSADDALGLTREEKEVEIIITDKDDLDDVAQKLKEAGAINSEWLFKTYCKVTGKENFFDPGIYTIKQYYDFNAITNNLMAGAANRETVTIMIREGADCFEIFDLLEQNNVCSREALEQTAASYEYSYTFLKDLEYGESNRLEGYLFPDTYQFYLMDEPENVIGRFLRNYNARLSEEDLQLIEESGYTMHEILTMASIVEAEAGSDEDRALIASVIFNRLTRWDPGERKLGMDSTVYYGAKLQGKGFSTDLDSPYNTYQILGLPPGPICNPGLNSIRAVLHPEETDYFYFLTGVDGKNHFFETKEEHEAFRNSDQYQDIIPEEYQNP